MEKNQLKRLGRNFVKVAKIKGGEDILNGIERNREEILQTVRGHVNSKGSGMAFVVVDVTGYMPGEAMRVFSDTIRREEGIDYTTLQDCIDGHDYIYALFERSQRDSERSDREETIEMLDSDVKSEYRLEEDEEVMQILREAIIESFKARGEWEDQNNDGKNISATGTGQQESFCSLVNETATFSDLDEPTVREYLKRVGWSEEYADLTLYETAQRLDLLADGPTPETQSLFNHAVLMFVKNPSDFIPGALTVLANYQTLALEYFDEPVWKQYERIIQYFEKNIKKDKIVWDRKKQKEKTVSNFSQKAFEELVANSILHRDYETDQIDASYISVGKDLIIVTSAGIPLSQEELTESQEGGPARVDRNPVLRDWLIPLGQARKTGKSGLELARKELSRNGAEELKYVINSEDNQTQIMLRAEKQFFE